jgi:hypothetical protein
MINARKDIIFRDEHYHEKFRIKDGDSIKITVDYDGEELVRKCRFLDAAHMEVGSSSNTYHMDEFMERQTQAGNVYEPVPNPAPTLEVLFVEAGREPRETQVPIRITALRELVGGPLAMIPVGDTEAVVFANPGDGAFDKSGTFAVCGLNDGNLASILPYPARLFKRELSSFALDEQKIPSLFTRMDESRAKVIDPLPEKAPTLQEQLAAAQKKAAAQNRGKGARQTERDAGRRTIGGAI